jgi:shikimate kinase/3-dehydroquinate synthase
LPAGEQHKTLATVRDIYDQLLAAGFDRQGTVVALGGGVVGDITGFAAATYMRGVDLVQCPTSLLAMVDASIGGKSGVDLPQGKNLVGAFKQPVAVLADLATLPTLPPAEFVAGMAEVLKHGLIAAPHILNRLEQGIWDAPTAMESLPALQSLVTEAIQVKRDVVQDDPFEQGRRAVLNLGHTFGHAIEQVSGYTIRHGEGVAMGLVAAAHLSATLGHCSPALQQRIEQLLQRLHLPLKIPSALAPESLYQAMGSDKKKAAGKLRFVLLRGIGDAFVTDEVPEAAVLSTLRKLSH